MKNAPRTAVAVAPDIKIDSIQGPATGVAEVWFHVKPDTAHSITLFARNLTTMVDTPSNPCTVRSQAAGRIDYEGVIENLDSGVLHKVYLKIIYNGSSTEHNDNSNFTPN